ncbi:glycosyltransferase family 39 protein [Candidatus Daviesbacteria bacterium]|nr:glycosyltransferase family 39 protein [Candidatus Daviesbacteria bacterium]
MNTKIVLVLILSLFLVTRFYRIAEVPTSLYWDEASIGYNAYSILTTGKDEWGQVLPVHFRAFGEYKLPIYIYTDVAFVKLFGLNELAVRLPSVLYTFFSVILIYLLTFQLTGRKLASVLSAFLFSISPWMFIFSRTGYEAVAGLTFYLLGIYLYLRSKSATFFILSGLAFAMSLFSYNSFRIIIPLTILVLLVKDFKKSNIRDFIKTRLLLVPVLIAVYVPILRFYTIGDGLVRFRSVGIFEEGISLASFKLFFLNYLSHFNPVFLFLQGDGNLRSQQFGFGQLFPVDLPFILVGIWYILKSNIRNYFLIIALLAIAPIPASLTKESPHALRSIAMSPFLSIFSAIGIYYLVTIVKKFRKVFLALVVLINLAFFGIYFYSFLQIYPTKSANDWQYPYKKLFVEKSEEFKKYNDVYISNYLAQPYIFYLFYTKYNAEKFLKTSERNIPQEWGFSSVSKIDNLHFVNLKMVETFSDKSLIVAPISSNVQAKKINTADTKNNEYNLNLYINE